MRSHIIADLSVNHVERSILRCGHTAERIVHDYGIDLTLYTYNDHGEPESDAISIQLKATDHLVLSQDQQVAPLSIERSDLERWLLETMPVILILYDAQADVAFWLYLQAYFAQLADIDINSIGQTFRGFRKSHVASLCSSIWMLAT